MVMIFFLEFSSSDHVHELLTYRPSAESILAFEITFLFGLSPFTIGAT
jgi:hypothetical protein